MDISYKNPLKRNGKTEMTAAQSSLIYFEQDSKMLSCTRKFVYAAVFNFNILILLIFAFSFFDFTETKAPEFEQSNISIEQNWTDVKNIKYAKYKISYPAKGIIHAKGFFNGAGVNILEINEKINPDIQVKPKTASNYINSKTKIKNFTNENVIAAVNGGYFKPQTGIPLGALVIDNILLTGPIYDRAALGINNDGTYSAAKTNFAFFLKNKKKSFKIDNINQPRILSTYTLLYTDKWGKISPSPPKYGANLLIENGKPVNICYSPVEIKKGAYVISAPENIIKAIYKEKNLKLEIDYPKEFKESMHIISGGPFLVHKNEIYIDTNEEKLNAITGKNPRTLIGYTKNDELIIATVDGREKHSKGMTLFEAAKFMHSLGCIEAINLDGGSSSVMYVRGQITNIPSVSGGIALSSTLLIELNSKNSAKINSKKQG
ncbi:MAG: phosphodiester glycosidase family protein [Candidatus Gastranaerophilales bacterium]|nr:phosphodiester glycosidase family protein [Candidatus Gastranaerophilales bacterium]